ncbi:MAG: Stp1/IreP family PP2C-type Ser/Thr phosphatase [Lachnospiraceae bacterium]|nr:Stp1/IreP family PP2C-type Ser/Thr phosphatase [Lachnospiraceae bacterium]
MEFYSKTDQGRVRSQNEDFIYASDRPIGQLPNVFLLADGMGGSNAGEYASRLAVESLISDLRSHPEQAPVEALKESIEGANRTIFQEAKNDSEKKGMGTTLVACSLMGMDLLVANVGDSRLYLYDHRGIRQLTRDHSFVEELLRSGKIQPEDARNHPKKHFITRAVGAEEEVKPDFFEEQLAPETEILLCTDGLTDMLSDDEIAEVLQKRLPLSEEADLLVETANAHGGKDNISLILIRP